MSYVGRGRDYDASLPFVSLFVCSFVCLCVCLFVSLSRCLFIRLFVCVCLNVVEVSVAVSGHSLI